MVLPGLGSFLFGRVVGFFQMGLALAGFALTAIWGFWFLKTWITLKQIPLEPGPHLGKALVGIGLFFIAWVWALGSSIAFVRKATFAENL